MKTYQKGVKFERFVKKYFEEEGYFVVRAAGSKGVADLVILTKDFLPCLVQCKVDKRISKSERERLEEICEKLGVIGLILQKIGSKIEAEFIGASTYCKNGRVGHDKFCRVLSGLCASMQGLSSS